MSGRNNALKAFMHGKNRKPKAPATFDILLGDAISKLGLNDDEIMKLGKLTATRGGIAHATLGHQVWYRERQLAELFNRSFELDEDGNKIYYRESDVDKYLEATEAPCVVIDEISKVQLPQDNAGVLLTHGE